MTPRAAAFPERLGAALAQGLAGLFVTVGADGWPHVAFTWVASQNPPALRVAVDAPSRSLANLETNARAAVQIIAPGNLVYVLKGAARVERFCDIPPALHLAVVELLVEQVRDQSWPLVAVDPLRYVWNDPRMADAERAVLRLLRGTAP